VTALSSKTALSSYCFVFQNTVCLPGSNTARRRRRGPPRTPSLKNIINTAPHKSLHNYPLPNPPRHPPHLYALHHAHGQLLALASLTGAWTLQPGVLQRLPRAGPLAVVLQRQGKARKGKGSRRQQVSEQ
jgi:hypothetical protein